MTDPKAELAEYQRQFGANRSEAVDTCGGLSASQFNLRPAPDRWSIAECIVHLNVSGRAYTDQIATAVNKARQRNRASSGSRRYGFLARWMIRAMEPPPRKRYKSPIRFTGPGANHEIAQVLDEFKTVGQMWEESLEAADGLHLAKVKVASPAQPLLRFPIGALFAIMAAHERRHLWQARRVREGIVVDHVGDTSKG